MPIRKAKVGCSDAGLLLNWRETPYGNSWQRASPLLQACHKRRLNGERSANAMCIEMYWLVVRLTTHTVLYLCSTVSVSPSCPMSCQWCVWSCVDGVDRSLRHRCYNRWPDYPWYCWGGAVILMKVDMAENTFNWRRTLCWDIAWTFLFKCCGNI